MIVTADSEIQCHRTRDVAGGLEYNEYWTIDGERVSELEAELAVEAQREGRLPYDTKAQRQLAISVVTGRPIPAEE